MLDYLSNLSLFPSWLPDSGDLRLSVIKLLWLKSTESLNKRTVLAVINENPKIKIPNSPPLLLFYLFFYAFVGH